jgi:hypothetical protein
VSFVNDYVSYFEGLAKTHESILHNDSEKHFFRLDPEEYLVGLKSDVNYPALMLEGYDCNFTDREANSILKSINGAFAIIKHLEEEGDTAGMHEIWDECEQIGLDILVRTYNEKYVRTGIIIKLDFNTVNMQLLANEADRAYGCRFTYSLIVRQNHLIDNSKWTDKDD